MREALIILILIFLFGCKSHQEKHSSTAALTNKDNVVNKFNPVDSVSNLLHLSLSKDTLEDIGFYNEHSPYNMIYFKMGYLFTGKNKSAVALYTVNETTVICELFSLQANKWIKSGYNSSLYISGFSPAYFSAWFDDYNFDGYKDLYINFYTTMGLCYNYGYLLTYNPPDNSLKLHNETIKISNMEINKKNKTISSVEYTRSDVSPKKDYYLTQVYQWKNDSLKLFSQSKKGLKK